MIIGMDSCLASNANDNVANNKKPVPSLSGVTIPTRSINFPVNGDKTAEVKLPANSIRPEIKAFLPSANWVKFGNKKAKPIWIN